MPALFCVRTSWTESSLSRAAACAASVLAGFEEKDSRLARMLTYGAGGYGAFLLLSSAATAETAFKPTVPALTQADPQGYPGGSLTGLFNSGGLLGEFAAGFLGSGVLGLLFGRGLFGGIGSVPSYVGLAFQLALIAMLARLIWTRWRAGDSVSPTALSSRELADPYLRSRDDLHAGVHSSAGEKAASPPDRTAHEVRPPELTDTKCH